MSLNLCDIGNFSLHVNSVQCTLLQVVPTIYRDVRNNTINSNQYSVTEHFKRADIQQGQNMPGVFFFYDLSPIKVCDYKCLKPCGATVSDCHLSPCT